MALETGLQAMKNAIAQGKSRASGGGGQPGQYSARLDYFSWRDGDKKILRFLTDDVIVAPFADRVVTNTGKAMDFLVDPDNNLIDKYGGFSRDFVTGEQCAPKLARRGVGVAVLRDERPTGETYPGGGQKTEVVDYLYQKDVGGTQLQARWFGIIKQSTSNFWDQLVMGSGDRFGTLCDRDYEVTRIGGDKNTKYSFIPLDPIDELRDPEAVQMLYGYGKPWDQNDPQRFLYCPQTLAEWADYYGGEDRVKFWLESKGASGGSFPAQAAAAPVVQAPATQAAPWASHAPDEPQAQQPPTNTDFADLRSRLMPHLQSGG